MSSNIGISTPMPIEDHLSDLHKVLSRTAIGVCLACIFWSYAAPSLISEWLGILPLHDGNSSDVYSVYGPFEWIETRWALILLSSAISMMPLGSIMIYRFSRVGLYPRERKWIVSVLIFATVIVPLTVIAVWAIGIPLLIEFAHATMDIDGIEVRYDAASIFSLALGISWILIVWSLTLITLSLTRLFGLVDSEGTRMRMRMLAISFGILVLTLPIEFDGLRILSALAVVISADLISRSAPARIAGNSN